MAGKELELLLIADMEGISGVTKFLQIVPGTKDWEEARQWMTDDVNAAVEGVYEGASKKQRGLSITVVDGHWWMNNLDPKRIDRRVEGIVLGTERKPPQLAGLNDKYHGIIEIGSHAQTYFDENSGPVGILAHTRIAGWVWTVNDIQAPEAILNAYSAAEYGVPLIMVTGDDVICGRVEEIYGQHKVEAPEKVVVKGAWGYQSGSVVPIPATQEKITNGASAAIQYMIEKKYKPLKCAGPVEIKIKMGDWVNEPETAKNIVGVEYAGDRNLTVRGKTYAEAMGPAEEVLAMFYGQGLKYLRENTDAFASTWFTPREMHR